MPTTTRRTFLKQTGLVVGTAASSFLKAKPAVPQNASHEKLIPPHRNQIIPALHAYSLERSVAAGQTLTLCVSSTIPYKFSICRLGLAVDDPSQDTVLFQSGDNSPRSQAIHPGSYVFISKAVLPPRQLSVECWVRPWKIDSFQGLVNAYDFPRRCHYGIFISRTGGVSFYLGDGQQFREEWMHSTPTGLLKGKWHHLVAASDGGKKEIWIDGQKQGSWEAPTFSKAAKSQTLRLAGAANEGLADHFLDGDLAMPVIYDRCLTPVEISARFDTQGLRPPRGKSVLACWTFSEEGGEKVADRSGHGHHGKVINHATWMIGGPGFKAPVPRFGNYFPEQDHQRGNGLRFASDDLYDCGWSTTHRYRIPPNARSGFYVARFNFEFEGQSRLYHHTFIVRKARSRPSARILLLAATNTWTAYSGTPFAITPRSQHQVWGTGGIANTVGDPPAFNFYRAHAAGQGTYQIGLRMPWPVAGPYVLYGGPTRYSHLMRADRFAQVWLEEAGYEYDLVSDLDVHREPDLLKRYQIFIINGHSEYWSLPMYRGLDEFLRKGGNVVCLSGNSLFWRVSFNQEGTIIECRKVDAPGEQVPSTRRGEAWHSHDGKRGGLLRECGFPGWKLIGLETLGWNNQSDARQFGPYHVTGASHFLFQTPEKVSVSEGSSLGAAPDGNLPRANGHEIDIRLSTLAALQKEVPPTGAQLPSEPPGMVQLANGTIAWKLGGAAFDYFFRPIKPESDQGGEMIYWERPEGGRVFNAGSIGSGWALQADPNFQKLMRNVLHHFGVSRPNSPG